MKKATEKKAGKKPKAAKARKAADLEGLRQRLTGLVASKAVTIVGAALEDAEKKINVAAMKYLFEMIGLYPARAGEEKSAEKPDLVDTLLQNMGLPTEPRNAESS